MSMDTSSQTIMDTSSPLAPEVLHEERAQPQQSATNATRQEGLQIQRECERERSAPRNQNKERQGS